MAKHEQLIQAIDLALGGNWDEAHTIVQQADGDANCCRVHAVLHKIEGDVGNAKYWYARSGGNYDDYEDPMSELAAIRKSLAE